MHGQQNIKKLSLVQ